MTGPADHPPAAPVLQPGLQPDSLPGSLPGSLQWRLLTAAALGIGGALLVVGLLLSALFRQQAQADLALRVQGQIEGLIGALAVAAPSSPPSPPSLSGPSSPLTLQREPIDPAYRQPFSGQYWLVLSADSVLLRSRSWWDHTPALPNLRAGAAPGHPSDAQPLLAAGPRGQALLVWAREVQLPGVEQPVWVAVAVDRSGLDASAARFTRLLVLALAALALLGVAAAWMQVRLGLAPLAALRAELLRLRTGHAAVLQGRHPTEVQPLVDDLNALLAHNAAILDTAREQNGNLAHALKTPLAVLGNLAHHLPPEQASLMDQQLAQMRRHVELHLVRARASAQQHDASRQQGAGTEVQPLLDGLLRTLNRLYAERGLALQATAAQPGLRVLADPHELQEMLGNLLDNACKWALLRVDVRLCLRAATGGGAWVQLEVHDDGPGIPVAQRSRVLQRGGRLDENLPGSGLGLAITADLARLHGGSLSLHDSPLGGLCARLDLKAPCVLPNPLNT